MIRVIGACFAISLASNAFGADRKTPKYPDLSDPRAAACSLGIALARGDAEIAKTIYIGDDKRFFALVDAFARAAASGKKLATAVTDRFGENAETLASAIRGPQPLAGNPLLGLTGVIALAEVQYNGDEAILSGTEANEYTRLEGKRFVIRLKKVGKDWKVREFPALTVAAEYAELCAGVLDEVRSKVEEGKYKKVYEVWRAIAIEIK